MEARAAHLIQDGMARRDGERIPFNRNLIGTPGNASWTRSATRSRPRPVCHSRNLLKVNFRRHVQPAL